MECPSCHTAMRDGAKFCGKCGTALPRGCFACGHINPSDDRFCSECGASLARVGMQATSPEIINSTPSTAP
jgi:RNA polymerase subunit RPABC4/transcription elongation factor Spt4